MNISTERGQSKIEYALIISLVAIAAIPAGILFLIDPTGHKNGISSAILANSPFIDFFMR